MTDDGLLPSIEAFRVPLDHTKDTSGLQRLLADGQLRPDDVIAVTGKTEGWQKGETSRVDADQAIRRLLLDNGTRNAEVINEIPMVFTTGGIGILTPHVVVYARSRALRPADGGSRLAVGVARSATIQPEWMATTQLLEANADAVRAAAAGAGMDPSEIEYVVGKAYYPNKQDFADARAAGRQIRELEDKVLFRKASGSAGLGVAVAADGMAIPAADDIGRNFALYSAKVAVSANEREGTSGAQTQLVALGNSAGAGGRLRVGHSAMNDTLDANALTRALQRAGLDVGPGPLSDENRKKVVAVYVKFAFPPEGKLRGRRQITENPEYGSQVKAAIGGMYSSILQDNLVWISASATHQGPEAGGTVAAVIDAG